MAKIALRLTEGPWQTENYEIFARLAEAALDKAEIIGYDGLVDLIVEHNVANFV